MQQSAIYSLIKKFCIACLFVVLTVYQLDAQDTNLPKALEGLGVTEMLGSRVDLDLEFVDEFNTPVRLGDYFENGKPVLLNLVYFDCPTLCSSILDGLTKGIGDMSLKAGDDYKILTVSFAEGESAEQAREARAKYLERLKHVDNIDENWSFLVGEKEDLVSIASAVGFEYRWDEGTKQYAHPAVLVFMGPEGKITRYMYGARFKPRDLRTAFVEASQGKIGTVVDRVILYCYRYDSASGEYVLYAKNLMTLAGGLTVLILGFFLFLFWRRESNGGDNAPRLSDIVLTD